MTIASGGLRQAVPVLTLLALVGAVLVALLQETTLARDGTREVVDESGRQVRFTPGERRALYMGTGAGEYLLTTRRPKHLLTSRSPVNERLLGSPLLRRAMPDLDTVDLGLSSSEGSAANLETLLWQRPDLMITWSRLVDRFERVGIPATGFGPVTRSPQLDDHARFFGALSEEPARAAGIVARSAAERATLARDMARSEAGATPTSVLFLYPSGRSWRTTYEFAEVVAAAADKDLGLPLALRAGIDAERLLALAPEVIVIGGGDRLADDAAMRLMADPALAAVPAVAQRRVYRRPPGFSGYLSSTIELPIYERWLAEVLHPDRLAPATRAAAARIIEREFDVRASDDELDELLGVPANRGSAHATRFARATL